MKKLICVLLLFSLMLTSCGGVETTSSNAPEPKIQDIGDYSLVIPKIARLGERDMVVFLKETIEDTFNVTLKVSIDTKESVGKEILIGNTNREASQISLKFADYIVKQDGDNFVINGGSKFALKNAVDLFVNEFLLGENPQGELLKTKNYPHENSTVDGIKLTDFAVVGDNEDADALREALGNATGVMPKSEGENCVVFDVDETLTDLQTRCVYKDGNIVICSSGKGISKKQSVQSLTEFLSNTNPGALTVDLTKEFIPETFAVITDDEMAVLRKQTDERIEEIKNTPNMRVPKLARVFYISPNGSDQNNGRSPEKAWQTIERLNLAKLRPGDYVLFERGGYYRGTFTTQTGVTYSAYGEGKKPIICGSPEDGANPNKWTEVAQNIWMYETAFERDVGTIVYNHGENYSVKWLVYENADGILEEFKTKALWTGVESLKNDLDMWHNNAKYSGSNYKVYVRSEQNPGERFSSIEFLWRDNAIWCNGNNVVIDNLEIRYAGASGIGGHATKNFVIQNCTFEWIGGSLHFVNYNVSDTPMDRPVRYGNGAEIYGGIDGFEISNCYFNQIYDAALTHQFGFDDIGSKQDCGHYNVTFKDNVVERCTYSIELFLEKIPDGNTSHYDNIVYENNLMWYCGTGFGSQRPVETSASHIKGWKTQNPVKNFVIRNNLLAYSANMFVHASFTNINENGETGLKLENNTFIGEYGQKFGFFGYSVSEIVNYNSNLDGYLKEHGEGNNFYIVK